MSELYLDDLRDKTHRGLEGRAIAKFSAGGLPFGYRSLPVMDAERVIGFRREAHPEHAAIVVEIFERFSDGATMRQIASDLNARGVPSPGAKWKRAERRNDGRWLVSALHALLHNEIYSGRYIWNRSEWLKDPDTGRRIRRERPESQWVVNDMPELALVAQPTWERVKARLASRSVAYGRSHGGAPKFLLSGLLRCEECGAAMTIFGGEPRRYGCSTHRHGGASACSMDMSAPRRVAEEIILRPVIDGLLSDEAVELALEEMRAYAGASIDPPDEATVRDIARLDAQIAQLERMVREGLLSPAVASAGLEQADSERRALLAATRRKKTVRPLVVRSAAETAYRAEASRLHAALTGKVVSVAREALREVVGEVKVRPAVSRKYLEAQIRLSPVPLLKVAGADHYSIGSGGRI